MLSGTHAPKGVKERVKLPCKKHTLRIISYATAGQEDPFELDSSLLLSSGWHGEVVRGSIDTTLRHPYL